MEEIKPKEDNMKQHKIELVNNNIKRMTPQQHINKMKADIEAISKLPNNSINRGRLLYLRKHLSIAEENL